MHSRTSPVAIYRTEIFAFVVRRHVDYYLVHENSTSAMLPIPYDFSDNHVVMARFEVFLHNFLRISL